VTFTNTNHQEVTDWAGVLSLQLDRDTPGDGRGPLVPVFCIQVNVLVRGGDRYVSDGPVTALHGGCQIRYLLDRYPASTATSAAEAAARQLAIWHFSDDIDLTTVREAAIRARAISLADEAALAITLGGCPGAQTNVASLTLDPATASVVAGQVINYTVQADPPGAAQSVDITISGAATLQNGQQQATLPLIQGVATFSVVNPVAGTSTITARLPYVLDAGTVFSPINAGRPTQRLVMGDSVSLSASATVRATWGQATATPTAAAPTPTVIGGSPTATPAIGSSPTATPAIGGSPTATPANAGSPTATPANAGSPTATPAIGGSPTATPAGAGSPTATPAIGGSPTATPAGAGSPTATPAIGGSPTATPAGTGSPTTTPPTQATPVDAPPPAPPTHKPSGGAKPSPIPASQTTPESTPPNGSASPTAGTPTTGGTGPTPVGGGGNAVPGVNGGAGGAGGDTSGNGAQASAGGTNDSNQIRPSQLPNTGDTGSATPLAIIVAALLIAGGVWLRILRKRLA
jgi:LPXTG-motif cell wall-anchored protein